MLFAVFAALWCVLAFLAGSVPFGWLIARARGIEIRQHGSGNIGGTNVWRVLGWKPGVACLLLDTLKGLLPVVALSMCMAAVPDGYVPDGWVWPLKMLVAICAVLGHTFTPLLRFRGGKGIATGLGVILALYGWWVLPVLGIFGVVLLTTRFVSLGSLMAALFLFLFSASIESIRPLWPFALLALLLVAYTHRANIARLIAGTESQVGVRKLRANGAEPAAEPADESTAQMPPGDGAG